MGDNNKIKFGEFGIKLSDIIDFSSLDKSIAKVESLLKKLKELKEIEDLDNNM
jgi:hypothetical protein